MTSPGERSDEPRTWFVDALTGEPITEAERTQPLPTIPTEPKPRRQIGLLPALAVFGAIVVAVGTVATYRAKTADSPPPMQPSLSLPSAVGPTRIDPVIAGWQPVSSDDQPFVFDVPADWAVEEPDVAVGYETPKGDLVTLQGVARYRNGFCPGLEVSSRALAGFTSIDVGKVTDVVKAAEETTLLWAEAAYSSVSSGRTPQTEIGPPGSVPVMDGTVVATSVTTTVVPAEPGPCDAPSVAITAIALPLRAALPGSGRYHVFLVLADQEVPEAIATDVVLKMGGTIRRW
jgi:hypothetical protein